MNQQVADKSVSIDVQPQELHQMDTGGYTLVDVREPAEYAYERIAGAMHMPLGALDP